ncbi:MAG TPA: glycosyltransferase family 4 protein [Oligoflexia bacterium]|nr:glycosyltransferase family 4 protein [Oligoflexia bacterium]HMR23802.1 glycosyltransferase family 4 protein [Oligoflexia bacterium]
MKKNIFFISSYFYPERGAGAVRAFEFVKTWSKKYNIDVFTNVPNYPFGRPYKGYRLKFPKATDTDSFKFTVHRVFTLLAENSGFLKRSIAYIIFCLSTFLNILFYKKKPTLVIATSPQLLTSLSGVLTAKYYKVPFILDVRDLWPEAIIESGVAINKYIIRILKSLSAFAYKSAKIISVTTEVQKKKIVASYNVPSEKIKVIANGYNAEMFKPINSDDKKILEFKKLFGKNHISVGYIGNLAFYYDFDVFLSLAKDFKDINFVLMGEGSQKNDLEYKINQAKLNNLKLLDSIDYEDVPYAMNALDMGIVKHKDNMPITESMLPVKLFEYIACNTPCIYYGKGEGAALMKELNLNDLILNFEQGYEMLKSKIQSYNFKNDIAFNKETLKCYAREALALNFQNNIIDKVIVP